MIALIQRVVAARVEVAAQTVGAIDAGLLALVAVQPDDGEPQGLGPRSAIAPPPSMATAKEQLPPNYSDFGRTAITRVVPIEGGTFDFDLTADIEKARTLEPTKVEASKSVPAKPAAQ